MNTEPGSDTALQLINTTYGTRKVQSIGSIIFMDEGLTFWAWSPYDRCSFRCVYCSVEAQGKSRPQISSEEIPELLDAFESQAGDKYPFYIGVTADAYPDIEQEHQLMRVTLSELIKRPAIRTIICTHGSMITRDIDLLKAMPNLEGIGITIPMHQDENIRKLEPGAPLFQERINAALTLWDQGLPVHVNITPWMPEISEADEIGKHLPPEMKVNVGVLSYNHHNLDLIQNLFGRKIPSAEKVFGKRYSQEMINEAYLAAHQQIKGGTNNNLNWLVLPNTGKNHIATLSND